LERVEILRIPPEGETPEGSVQPGKGKRGKRKTIMMNEKWEEQFREQIHDFVETIGKFDKGEIDRKAYKGISGGFGSYAQRDPSKHMLRLRMAGGNLTEKRLEFLTEAVKDYGVELMKLTTCETVQLHNLKAEQVPVLMEKAIDAEIYSRGGGGDNPRNIMMSPLSGVQKGEAFDVKPYAEAAAEYLLSIAGEIHMPRKLKVAFCNGADDSVHSAFRDMGFMANPDGTFTLRIAGGLGGGYKMGVLVDEHVQVTEILYYIRAMIETFCQHGNYENRAKARTRFMQETLGVDGLKTVFLENVQKMKEKGGLDLHVEEKTVTKKGSGEISDKRVIAQKQPGLYAVAYHPIGGCLPAGKPAELLALLKEIPDAECRIAPHETIYIINLTADEAKKVLAATADGAQTTFENSVACIGASICQQGVRDSQAALRAAVAAVREAGIPDGALPKICISGCPSSCSAHQAAALGFQGAAKTVDGKPESAFKMFVGGSDKLGAAKFGEAGAVILERDLPKLLVELGKAAAASNMNWETWIDGHGDEFRAIVEKYA
jgi:sulfite reductase beta subunit-like hemoprotein